LGQSLCLTLEKALNGNGSFVARTLWSARVIRCELTSRISAVFHVRNLPHQQSKLNEIAQSLGIKLINVIDLSFFFAFISRGQLNNT
jgi:hypothetical protein